MVQSLVNCTRNVICAQQSLIFRSIIINFCSNSKNNNGNPDDSHTENKILTIPEPPTTCCMSGCANCVWIEYAEKLTKFFNDGGDKARKQILEKVTDSNMRAFLMMELRNMKQKE